MKQKTKNKKQKNKGFTLVELLVGVAVFALVGGIASGILVSGLRAQRKSLAYQEILDQTSYLMEYISRAVSMAKKDDVGGIINCLTGDKVNYEINPSTQGIKFRNYKNECQEFYLENNQLKENKAGNIYNLTSSGLQVTYFNIGPLDTWDQDDDSQPRVTLSLAIQGKEQSKIKIQTTISQRNLDVLK